MGGNGDSMKKINLLIAMALVACVVSVGAADPIDEGRVKHAVIVAEAEAPPTVEQVAELAELVPEPGERWPGEVVAIARACVNEADLERVRDGQPMKDCGAIVQVARWHAANKPHYGGSNERAIRRLSRRTFDRARTDGRRWVAWLTVDLAQPRGWPGGVTWRAERWEATLVEVAEHMSGVRPPPCPEDVFHWGGPHVDAERIERGVARRYWRIVDCGGTLNTFLAPRVMPAQLARGRQGDL